jgi:glycine/D-amino acid oxidase-like deaminating enzyme
MPSPAGARILAERIVDGEPSWVESRQSQADRFRSPVPKRPIQE